MLNESAITPRQTVWALFLLFTSFAVIQIPAFILSIADRDSWLIVIYAWCFDVLFGAIYAYMGWRFPKQNMIQHGITLWGKIIGRIPGLFLLLLFLTFSIITQYSLFALVSKLMLPDLSPEIILGVSFMLSAYIAKKGITTIMYFCEAIGPLFFVSLLLLVLLISPELKLDNLKPQLTLGFFPSLVGAFVVLNFLGICIMMTMYTPLTDQPEKGFLTKFVASSLGSFILMVLVVYISGVFGVFQAKEMFYPGLELARIIRIGNFSGRVEMLWIVITLTVLLTGSASLIWAFSKGFSHYIGARDHQCFIYPTAFLGLTACLTAFNNDLTFELFSLYVYPLFPTLVTCFEILLALSALMTRGSRK